MESTRHTAPDHEPAVPEALQQLRDELNALKTANAVAKAELDKRQDEVVQLLSNLDRLEKQFAGLVPKVQVARS